MDIQNNHFVVTGGSSGLGAAVTRRLVAAGGMVTIADVNVAKGEELAAELGANVIFAHTDITSTDSVQACLDKGVASFGEIKGLVNCAGIPGASRVVGRNGPHDLEMYSRIINVNLVGTFNIIRLAAEKMQHNAPGESDERGVIINTASVAAYDGQIGQAAYSASKGGIVSMTLPLAREFANFGIRVMTIAPGMFLTPMVDALPPEAQASLGAAVPFPKRLGRPEEYAQLAQQIIENVMLNGEVIRLDGSIRMQAK